MLVRVDGKLNNGVASKDVVLHVCGIIGTAGGTGATIEFAGTFLTCPFHNVSLYYLPIFTIFTITTPR
jgi:hypothetical protein